MNGPRHLRFVAPIALAGLMTGACVTVVEEVPLTEDQIELPDYAVAQTIPLGSLPQSQDEQRLLELYDGILRRMQEAVDDRQVGVLFGLLDSYQKPGLPGWLADRLAGYRGLAHGLKFLAHAVTRAELQLMATPPAAESATSAATGAADAVDPRVPPIGEPLQLQFVLPPMATPVRFGGREDADPVTFAIAITYEDLYVHGGSKSPQAQGFESLPREFVLQAGDPLRLPIQFDIPTDGAVRRTVHVRVDILPGYVRVQGSRQGEVRAPIERRTLAARSVTQYPAGYEPIEAQPLATMREAVRLGDGKHYPHVFLGALFTSGAERQQAIALLIDQVRFAPEAPAMIAMAALREITDADVPTGDRDAWLAWWDSRR